ncbi:hypothetical protein SLS54_009538 [Diplodia seriata]
MEPESQTDFNTYCAFCGVHFTRQSLGHENMVSDPRLDEAPCQHCRQGVKKPGHSTTCHSRYSPELLSRTNLGWLRRFYILQLSAEPDHESGATPVSLRDVVGRAEGTFMARNSIGLWEHFHDKTSSYYGHRNDPIRAFPFHQCCYALFIDVLAAMGDPPHVDMEILFRTMRDLTIEPSVQALSLDYGDLTPRPRRKDGKARFWESLPGEEFFVSHPTPPVRGLEESLRKRIAIDHQRTHPTKHTEPRISNDPFSSLPPHLLDNIHTRLDSESLVALGEASAYVDAALHDSDAVWKLQIVRAMPWFPEMHNIVNDTDALRGTDCRNLFLWLRETTQPRLFVEKTWLGVVNRRRIWKVCEEFAAHYRAMKERCYELRAQGLYDPKD